MAFCTLRNTGILALVLSALSVLPGPATAADSLPQLSSLAEQLPTLVAAEDVFGEVFLAGMSIAAASVVATIFVGVVVRGNYDAIEESFFEAQEDALTSSTKEPEQVSQSARDFFGDVNVREAAPAPPPAQPEGEPAEKN